MADARQSEEAHEPPIVIPIFNEPEIRAAVTPSRAVATIHDAFRADGEGRTVVPTVINLSVPGARGEFHIKTALIAARAASGPEEVYQEADLVVTTTRAREPLICAEWLRSGQHVTAVGADSPGKQELDPRCFAR